MLSLCCVRGGPAVHGPVHSGGGAGGARGSVVNVFSFAGCGVSGSFQNLVAESQKWSQDISEQMWPCSRSFVYRELGGRCGPEAQLTGSIANGTAGRGWLSPPPFPRAMKGRSGSCSLPGRGARSVLVAGRVS